MSKENSIYFKYLQATRKYQNLYLVLVAVVIGIAAGFGNILFRESIAFFQRICYGSGEELLLPYLIDTPYYKILLVPAIGGLMVGIIYHFYKTPEGRGVPMVIKAIVSRKTIPSLTAFMTIITSGITIGTGGSAGREGPIVQIGASIGSMIGKIFGFSKNNMRFAIASGAGGGLAATFNTPMAGAMFTAEVLLGRLDFKVFAPVVISCVSATVVSRAYFGNDITFPVPDYALKSFLEIPVYGLLGLLVGIVGGLFIKFFYSVAALFGKLKLPAFVKPALGGLMVGLIGIFCRNVMGVGYGTIVGILDGNILGYFLLALVGLKILATSLTLGSGGSGGLFVPSLFVGAALGGFFGWALHLVAPDLISTSGSYALVGMGAMLAATMRAPITAILMIFEITQNYQTVLPLMAAVIIANVCSSWIEKDSFFTRPLSAEGFDINKGKEMLLMEQVTVKEIMLTDVIKFRTTTPALAMLAEIRRHPHMFFPVVDENNILKGILNVKDLREALFDPNVDNSTLTAADFCKDQKIIMITPYNTLAEALALFAIKETGDLPVVNDTADKPEFVGLLKRSDILTAYNNKLRASRAESD